MTEPVSILSRMRSVAVFIARQPLTLWVAFVLVHLWLGKINLEHQSNPMGDVTYVYKFWVDQFVVNGFRVGIDSEWVYPILAFLPMLAAIAFGGAAYGATWLSVVMLLNLAAFGVLTGWGRRREHFAAGWWWLVFLVLLGPIALGRIDAVSVALAMIAVLVVAQRPRLGAAILAIATWIKVWPAALVVAVLIVAKERVRVLVVGVAVTAVIVTVALILGSGTNVFSFITLQTGRGLQVEAPISTIWLWMAASGVPETFVYYNQQILTFQVDGPGAEVAAGLMTPLLAIAVLAIAALGLRAVRAGSAAVDLLPVLCLALVTAFIVFNKVGSPQFESWLAVPVVFGIVAALRGGYPFRTPVVLVLVIAALTQLVYPYLYNYLLALHPLMLIAVSARNLLLVILLGWAVAAVVRLGMRRIEADEAHNAPVAWPFRASAAASAVTTKAAR